MAPSDQARPFIPVNIAVLTVSDSRDLETDKSGRTLQELAMRPPGGGPADLASDEVVSLSKTVGLPAVGERRTVALPLPAELIEELEPVRRGLYAGTVGYFGHGGAMDQAIAIRTMWFRDGTYRYQAGAGVVADSVPASEYDEIRAKARALEAAMALAEEGL